MEVDDDDADDQSVVYNLGILVNAPTTGMTASNCRLCISHRFQSITLRATRDIHPNDEILLAYGCRMTRLVNLHNE